MPDVARDYLARALALIGNGEDANKALGLKRGKGRPKIDPERDQWIACQVRTLMDSGMTLENAAAEVAESYSDIFSTENADQRVKEIYTKHKTFTDRFSLVNRLLSTEK